MRGFAIVVSALAAFAAQAQQAHGAEDARSVHSTAPHEDVERPVMVAARTAPATSARTITPGDGADAGAKPREGAAVEAADCSIVENLLGNLPLAVREYGPTTTPQTSRANGWWQVPYVAKAVRCGQRYFLQVKSESRDAWIVRQARLEGPGGEVLQVEVIRFNALPYHRAVNVIVAKAQQDAKLSRLKLDLSGEDGRVAQAEARDLP